MSATSIIPLGSGKMSLFGGPDDHGVSQVEGLALIEPADLASHWFGRLFLPLRPGYGLARSLNPRAYYVAMRWDYAQHPKAILRHALVRLSVRGRMPLFAQPVDYGPGDGSVIDGRETHDTGRIADLSPQCAIDLGLRTDDYVTCELILPEVES